MMKETQSRNFTIIRFFKRLGPRVRIGSGPLGSSYSKLLILPTKQLLKIDSKIPLLKFETDPRVVL